MRQSPSQLRVAVQDRDGRNVMKLRMAIAAIELIRARSVHALCCKITIPSIHGKPTVHATI